MVKKYDVITMGSGLVDAFLNIGAREKNRKICFPAGIKITIKNIYFDVGGGGTNSASCFSTLGLKTAYLGKVGRGYNAKIILRGLKQKGIDFIGIKGNGKEHTGYSIILETDKKHRTILTYKGASNNLRFSEVDPKKINANWLYFTALSGESFKTQQKILNIAFSKKIKVGFNPGARQIQKDFSQLRKMFKKVYFLTLNKEEARMIIPRGNYYKKLSILGPKIISVTNGEKEGILFDAEKKILYRYFPKKIYVSECTGAGDVFGSSLVSGLIKFNSLEKALKLAMVNSESVIQKRGAQKGLLNWNSALRRIKEEKFKIKKEIINN